MANNRVEEHTVNPENVISIVDAETDNPYEDIPAQGGAIQFGGYNRSAFEMNFFLTLRFFQKKKIIF